VLTTLATLLAANPLVEYVRLLFRDDPFRGRYHVNAFDLLIVIPYFALLIILSFYGLHRYRMVYLYRKYRRNLPPAPQPFAELPYVTIQLPLYNERYVVERLLETVSRMDYPRERLEIQVLDDSSDETTAIARAWVARAHADGLPIRFFHRETREGFKAGALAAGLKEARGEFIAVFDADFLPPPDFLHRTIHHFTNPRVGMVQTRWSYVNRDYSLLTRVEAVLLDGHFVLEHGGRSRAGLFFNFNGTAGLLRRAMIESAGGWQHDTLTEDSDLSYRAQLAGWKFLYLPEVECPSELPVEMNAFKAQQARWAKGLIQTAKKILPRVLRAPLPGRVKLEAFYHLTGSLSYPLMVALSVLLLPAMIIRFFQGWWQMLWLDLPLFLAATCSVSTFYLVAQRELYPRAWKRTFLYLPLLMGVGIGLAVRNAKAVLEALLGIETPFVRTPKYRIEESRSVAADAWYTKIYRRRAGWAPLAELALGSYFLWAVYYALASAHYPTLPFLALFLWGYFYSGLLSLAQPFFERLAPVVAGLAHMSRLAWARPTR